MKRSRLRKLLLLTEYDCEKLFCLDVFEKSVTIDLFDALVGFLLHHPVEYFSLVEEITLNVAH